MENSIVASQKSKTRATMWSSKSTTGHFSLWKEKSNAKRYLHPYVQSSTIYNSWDMEKT